MSRVGARETSASNCDNFLGVSQASREAGPPGDVENAARLGYSDAGCGSTREQNDARACERFEALLHLRMPEEALRQLLAVSTVFDETDAWGIALEQ